MYSYNTLVELIFATENSICTDNDYFSGQCNTHRRNLFVLFLAINLIRYVRLCKGLNCKLLNLLQFLQIKNFKEYSMKKHLISPHFPHEVQPKILSIFFPKPKFFFLQFFCPFLHNGKSKIRR